MTTDAGTPRQTPLLDLLMGVPKDGRAIYEHGQTHSQSIPYGRMCHEAADSLTAAEAERDALRARVAGLEAALKPFANFACDEPCQCNNCIARALLAPSSEPQP